MRSREIEKAELQDGQGTAPTTRPSKWSRALIALTLVFAATSCKTHHDQWSFSVTRHVYGEGGKGFEFGGGGGGCHSSGDGAALAVLIVLLLPVAVDLVILPVTLTHDLCDR